MPDNFEDVMRLARELGGAIKKHERYIKLRQADDRVRADKSATDALSAYNKAADEVSRKERSGQPIEVEDKRRLQHLHEIVAANEAVKAFMVSQADYAELMRRMNDAIFRAIAEPESPEAPKA
jgi:cell fate (sporulation/competence/biofilm development) regulator YlbF (YheA/YmcA/DUF963 family)